MVGPVLASVANAASLRAAVAIVLLVALLAALAILMRRAHPDAAPRQPLLAHVEELRRRVLASVATLAATTTAALSFRWETVRGLWVPVPALTDNMAAQVYRALADHLVPADVRLVAMAPLDGFMAELTIALGLGVALALPVLWAQAAAYVAPALRPRERRALAQLVLPAMGLFALGVAFGYVFVLPFLFDTLYGYAAALDAELLLHVQDFITFSFGILVVLGFAFQTPLVMAGLSRVGLVPARTWRKGWRVAVLVAVVLAALLTTGIPSAVMVAVPLVALYGVGLVAAEVAGKRRGLAQP